MNYRNLVHLIFPLIMLFIVSSIMVFILHRLEHDHQICHEVREKVIKLEELLEIVEQVEND